MQIGYGVVIVSTVVTINGRDKRVTVARIPCEEKVAEEMAHEFKQQNSHIRNVTCVFHVEDTICLD